MRRHFIGRGAPIILRAGRAGRSIADDRHGFNLDPCRDRREGADLDQRTHRADLIEGFRMGAGATPQPFHSTAGAS